MQTDNKTCSIRNAKMVRFFFAFILIVLAIFSLYSCKKKEVETFVSGDFVCYYSKKYSKDNSVGVVIKELSEEGKQKEVIVVPEYIDGYRVYIYEKKRPSLISLQYTSAFKASNIKKIFIMHEINKCHLRAFSGKIITVSMDYFLFPSSDNKVFIPYTNDFSYIIYENSYTQENIYNANVTYYVDNEIYWIDDYENELISFIPEEPKKEGKAFVGWFKEPECINKWNFEYDVVPKYIIGYDEVTTNNGEKINIEKHICTKLYAKFE